MKWIVGGMAAVACTLATAAAPVKELKPDELPAFVREHANAVVQLTSSDPRCGECKDADKTFDGAAAASRHSTLAFARVQWPVQDEAPGFAPLLQETGALPAYVIFRNGSVHQRARGQALNAGLLSTQFEDLLKLPADPEPYCIPGVYREPQPRVVTADEVHLVRLQYRSLFLETAAQQCSERFPGKARQFHDTAAAWKAAHRPALDMGTQFVRTLTSRDDLRRVQCLGTSEIRGLEAMAEKMPRQDSPRTEQGCQKTLDAAAALP